MTVTTSMPAAVLWDMDGTIVDSEPYWMTAQEELVGAFGGVWTHEAALTLVGSGMDRTARIMQENGVDLDADTIINRLSDRVMEQIAIEVPWRPGAPELLRSLREAGIKTALVTMSIKRMAEHVRSYIPFDAFDLVVAGDDVTHSKPHPEAYLTASRLLGVDPQDCVAIEDSVPGIASAAAAGVFTIGVPHFLSLDSSDAHLLWPTLAGRNARDIVAAFTDRSTH